MRSDKWALSKDPRELSRAVRMISASVNVAILHELARARRQGDGWMYLSEIANAIGEAPGTVGAGLTKLAPMLEEKREKGLRYFRADFTDLRIVLEPAKRDPLRPRRPLTPS